MAPKPHKRPGALGSRDKAEDTRDLRIEVRRDALALHLRGLLTPHRVYILSEKHGMDPKEVRALCEEARTLAGEVILEGGIDEIRADLQRKYDDIYSKAMSRRGLPRRHGQKGFPWPDLKAAASAAQALARLHGVELQRIEVSSKNEFEGRTRAELQYYIDNGARWPDQVQAGVPSTAPQLPEPSPTKTVQEGEVLEGEFEEVKVR